MTTTPDSQQLRMRFAQLRDQQQQRLKQFATREQLAQKEKDQQLVAETANYTVDALFLTLSKLQTTFGETREALSKEMVAEVKRLADIRQATEVEKQRLSMLQQVQIAAEACNLLKQEHEQQLQALEQEARDKHSKLTQEQTQQRAVWVREQQEYDAAQRKQQQERDKQRQQQEEEQRYQRQRDELTATSEFERLQREQTQQFANQQYEKDKNWAAREAELVKQAANKASYTEKVAKMPSELEDAVKKAREDAIRETSQEENHKAALLERERQAKKQGFALQIASLEKTLAAQQAKLAALNDKLQQAAVESQRLALTAVTSSKDRAVGNPS